MRRLSARDHKRASGVSKVDVQRFDCDEHDKDDDDDDGDVCGAVFWR